MNEEELFAQLDSTEKPFQNELNDLNNKPKKTFGNTERLWDKTDFDPKPINPEVFKKEGKSFAISYYGDERTISDDVVNTFVKVATGLSSKGYTFRHNGGATDKLQNEILAISNIKVESYLPWGKFNEKVFKPILKYPTKLGYEHMFGYHKAAPKLPAVIRARLASQIHSLLGKDCINPCDLLLCYNELGDEYIKKDTDFKKLGNLSFYFKVCKASNIPVYNLKKEDAIKRIIELINSKNS